MIENEVDPKKYKMDLNVSGLCARINLLTEEDDNESMPDLASSKFSSSGSDSGMSESTGHITNLCRDRRSTQQLIGALSQ